MQSTRATPSFTTATATLTSNLRHLAGAGDGGSISRRTSVLTTSGHLRTVSSTEYVIQSFLFSCHFGLQTIIAQRDLRRSSCEVSCCLLCDFNKIREGSTDFNRTPHYHIPENSFSLSSVVNMPTDRETQRT